MWAITTLKDFRIASYIRKIGMPKLLTLGMNHPVVVIRTNYEADETTMNLYEVAHLVSGPLGVVDLFLDEDEVLDRGRLLQDVLELGQELVRRDDVGHFRLIGVSMFNLYFQHFRMRFPPTWLIPWAMASSPRLA